MYLHLNSIAWAAIYFRAKRFASNPECRPTSDSTMRIFEKRAIDRPAWVTTRGCKSRYTLPVMCNAALMVSRCYAIRTTKYDSFLVNGARSVTNVIWTSSNSASRSLAHEAKEYRFSSSSSSACRDRTTPPRGGSKSEPSEYCYAYLHRCKRTLFHGNIKIIAGAPASEFFQSKYWMKSEKS